ncbi:hypothetical protein [Nocardioides marinisabuli]|nr:hypothetical protein [Nocardioides marinisabuli]
MRMTSTRGAVVALAVALAASPLGSATATEEPATAPVHGSLLGVATGVGGLCATTCTRPKDVDHRIRVDFGTGRFATDDPVPPGSYTLWMSDGWATHESCTDIDCGNHLAKGFYLQELPSGLYTGTAVEEEATRFVVPVQTETDAQPTDLGTLDTFSGSAGLTGPTYYYSSSAKGSPTTGIRRSVGHIDVPRGSRTIIETTGCGGRKYRWSDVSRGPGGGTWEWRDDAASQRYGRTMRVQVFLRDEGEPRRAISRAYKVGLAWDETC